MNSISLFGGPIELGYVDEATGLWTPLQVKRRNLITYGGSDILGRILSGNALYVPSRMYFEFHNGASPPTPTVSRDTEPDYYLGLTGTEDFLRVPLNFTPALSASSGNFVSNICTFMGVTSGSTGARTTGPLTFSSGALSKVFSAAIVASPTGDVGGDIVFARFNLDTAIAKIAGSQIGVKWQVQFP